MDQTSERKIHTNIRKVRSSIKKRGKRTSKRDRKLAKNTEKKTRSGCTYSPYEMYMDKEYSIPSNAQISQCEKFGTPPSRRLRFRGILQEIKKQVPANVTRRGSHYDDGEHSKENVAPTYNKAQSSQVYKKKGEPERREKTYRILLPKSGKKRGRKPRTLIKLEAKEQSAADTLNSSYNYAKWPSSGKGVSLSKFEIGPEEDEVKPTITIVDKTPSCHTSLPQEQSCSISKVKYEDRAAKKDEIDDLDIFSGKSGILDLVFPTDELCHSLDEEELGTCLDHGCPANVQTNEEELRIPIKTDFRNCMITDTDKYIFKSCFKNIHSQILNFDRYRGAETPGGEASLYDISETSPIESRKLYRKNFSDRKLNLWYNYVYHSAQMARIGGNSFPFPYCSSNRTMSLGMDWDDISLTPLPVRSSHYAPAEYIWKCNSLMGIPTVDEVLGEITNESKQSGKTS